jgi:hypothetical protein
MIGFPTVFIVISSNRNPPFPCIPSALEFSNKSVYAYLVFVHTHYIETKEERKRKIKEEEKKGRKTNVERKNRRETEERKRKRKNENQEERQKDSMEPSPT